MLKHCIAGKLTDLAQVYSFISKSSKYSSQMFSSLNIPEILELFLHPLTELWRSLLMLCSSISDVFKQENF